MPTFGGAFYAGCDIPFAIKLLELRKISNLSLLAGEGQSLLDTIDDLLLMEAAAKAKLNEILNRRAEEKNGS